MIPPVFPLLQASSAVAVLLGSDRLRVYPWGRAPEGGLRPYATYTVYDGQSENYLGQVPDMDNLGTQVDVWADTGEACVACAIAIRDALEAHAHVTSFDGSKWDEESKLYRCRMDFDFYKARA